MAQDRNFSEARYRQLRSQAALAGMPLSDYLLGDIHRPMTMEEWRALAESQ